MVLSRCKYMSKFQQCLSVFGQTAGLVGFGLMTYGLFKFVTRESGQGEGDARPIIEAIHAIRALVIGGLLTLMACACAYIDRFTKKA